MCSGLNPSEEEVMTASNKVWDGSGLVSWPSFATLLADMLAMAATSQEDAYRETFRADM